MKFLSLFAGIGGFDLGLEAAGHECAGQVEIDAFCGRVLAERFPRASKWTDVRHIGSDSLNSQYRDWLVDRGFAEPESRGRATLEPEQLDLLCGGFPCQDLSIAGKRAGLAGERSGLFSEIVRIAKAIRPTWGLFENVPGLLSSHGGRDFWLVLQGLRECWPAVGYRILDSRYFGVPQRRRRVFLVCGPSEADVRAVLFEPEGGGWDSQAGGEAGARVAASLTSGVGAASNDPRRRREDDENLVVTSPLTSSCFKRHDEDTDTLIAHSLNAEGHDASEDGTGRGVPLVAATLNSGGNDGGFRTETGEHLSYNRQSGGDVRLSPGLPSLHSGQVPATGVRRLTPLECERLQGFPDGWTCLCLPLDAYRTGPDESALLCKCPDSPRYRALGNAVTVNVTRWLGQRMGT